MLRICVYCGSNKGARPDYAAAATDLADVLVRHDLELVYGGASKGIMGILADRVLELGGSVHGVCPVAFLEELERELAAVRVRGDDDTILLGDEFSEF